MIASAGRFPERAHLVGAYALGKAQRVIRLLREALDLSSAASRSFDGLYAWCESAIGYGDFLGAARCLGTLREAWYRVVRPVSAHGRWPGRPVS